MFRPTTVEEARSQVMGAFYEFSAPVRWAAETPVFAKKVLEKVPPAGHVLDYGCGVGRLAREMLLQRPDICVVGSDNSPEMLRMAAEHVQSPERFSVCSPAQLKGRVFDAVCCLYVLQHVPALELREVIRTLYDAVGPSGLMYFCSSERRMAVRYDAEAFFDDRFLGVDIFSEVEALFAKHSALFSWDELEANPVLREMVTGENSGIPHPAWVYSKKARSSAT